MASPTGLQEDHSAPLAVRYESLTPFGVCSLPQLLVFLISLAQGHQCRRFPPPSRGGIFFLSSMLADSCQHCENSSCTFMGSQSRPVRPSPGNRERGAGTNLAAIEGLSPTVICYRLMISTSSKCERSGPSASNRHD